MTGKPVSGDKGIRTLDPLLARQVLSQLSYTPMGTSMQQQTISPYAFYLLLLCISSTLFALRMGLSGLEPPTSRLSGVRSNRLSYKPLLLNFHQDSSFARFHQVLCGNTIASLRKVYLFSNLRLRFRSSSLKIVLVTPLLRYATQGVLFH